MFYLYFCQFPHHHFLEHPTFGVDKPSMLVRAWSVNATEMVKMTLTF